jgi:hypothetical protein
VCKLAAVGHLVHKYDEIICSIHQGGHPASHHDPPVGGPWWGSFAKTTGGKGKGIYKPLVKGNAKEKETAKTAETARSEI